MKCPKCESTNTKKERLDSSKFGDEISKEIDTGDVICLDCGHKGHGNEFENIVKKTCKELGLTYKQLAPLIGVSEGRIKQLAISEVGEQVVKSCEMLLKIHSLENELKDFKILKEILKK